MRPIDRRSFAAFGECVRVRARIRAPTIGKYARTHTHTCVRPRGQNERVPACNAPANRAGSTRNRATLNQVTPETRTLARPSCAPRASSRSQWLHECLIFIWPAGTHIIFFSSLYITRTPVLLRERLQCARIFVRDLGATLSRPSPCRNSARNSPAIVSNYPIGIRVERQR